MAHTHLLKNKCPNCSGYTLATFKIFVADMFGWGVRCSDCQVRVSHARGGRYLMSFVFWLSLAFTFGLELAFKRIGGDSVFVVAALRVVALGLIVLIYCSVPLILLKEESNKSVVFTAYKVLLGAISLWGIILLFNLIRQPDYEVILNSALLLIMPVFAPTLVILVLLNWTI